MIKIVEKNDDLELELKSLTYTFARFLFFGAGGVIINLGTLFILSTIFTYRFLFSVVSLTIGQIFNYISHRNFVFNESNRGAYELAYYAIGVIIGYIINLSFVYIANSFGLFYLISQIIGIGAGTVTNFIFQQFLTFRKV